jgi:hypothetical protein
MNQMLACTKLLQVSATSLYLQFMRQHLVQPGTMQKLSAHFTSPQKVALLKFLQCMVLFHPLIRLVVLGIEHRHNTQPALLSTVVTWEVYPETRQNKFVTLMEQPHHLDAAMVELCCRSVRLECHECQ